MKVIEGENQVALVVSKDIAKYITVCIGQTATGVLINKLVHGDIHEKEIKIDVHPNELKKEVSIFYTYLRDKFSRE